MPRSLFHITLFLYLFALRFNVFACDTLCVVYNGKNKNFEIDTAKNAYWCHCNQKDLGIYKGYFNKLIVPTYVLEVDLTGATYLKIKGNEINIEKGIFEGFDNEIINCYKNNHFYFDSVFFRIRVPYYSWRQRLNNSLIAKEDLYKYAGLSKTNKKIEIVYSDSSSFRNYRKFIKKQHLIDLTKTSDSLFIRVKVGSICVENNIYELRYNKNGWQARRISYGSYEIRKFGLGFILFNKYHEFVTRKSKKARYFTQIKITPLDSNKNDNSWKAFELYLNKLNLFQLKTRNEADTLNAITEDGYELMIEIATPDIYRYIYWDNPDAASVSVDSKAVLELYKMLCNRFTSKENLDYKYKKNKWY
jgi:hypothetical protein